MKSLKNIAIISLFSIFFLFDAALAETEQPTILETTLLKADYGEQIMVKGLVEKDCLVLTYLDGVFYGFANITNNDPEINSFSYLSPVLKKQGNDEHSVLVIARNQKTLEMSSPAESKNFSIIKQSSLDVAKDKDATQEVIKPKRPVVTTKTIVPAPTLITPKGDIGEYKPIISGFSKNDTQITIYIDNLEEAKLVVNNHQSGTANFSYTPKRELTRGVHFTYATAKDFNGNESSKSNFLYFFIANPQSLATSSVELIEDAFTSSTETSLSPTTSSSTVLNKTRTKIVSSAFNISLLLLFVVGVIIWMATTNADLRHGKKEKKSDEGIDKK
jgi:hypothetical protein